MPYNVPNFTAEQGCGSGRRRIRKSKSEPLSRRYGHYRNDPEKALISQNGFDGQASSQDPVHYRQSLDEELERKSPMPKQKD